MVQLRNTNVHVLFKWMCMCAFAKMSVTIHEWRIQNFALLGLIIQVNSKIHERKMKYENAKCWKLKENVFFFFTKDYQKMKIRIIKISNKLKVKCLLLFCFFILCLACQHGKILHKGGGVINWERNLLHLFERFFS